MKVLEHIDDDEGIEGQVGDAKDALSALGDDLTGNEDEGIQKLFELHVENLLPRDGIFDEQAIPGFEIPGQGGNNHISPIGKQCICWCVESGHTVFELFDGIFLVASLIDPSQKLRVWRGRVIGDIEEISDLISKDFLALGRLEVFLQHDHPIGFFTGSGLIVK